MEASGQEFETRLSDSKAVLPLNQYAREVISKAVLRMRCDDTCKVDSTV